MTEIAIVRTHGRKAVYINGKFAAQLTVYPLEFTDTEADVHFRYIPRPGLKLIDNFPENLSDIRTKKQGHFTFSDWKKG